MVARFQSIISEELKKQLIEVIGRDYPDHIIACIGGGSNAAGIYFHYLENEKVELIAAEAAGKGIESGESAATSILGSDGIIHGSKTMLMQTDDGQIVEPYSISAGLDYPGIGPLHAQLIKSKRLKVYAITDVEALNTGLELARLEGIIPALESAHAFGVLNKRNFGHDDIVVINLSGRGDKDMEAYGRFMDSGEKR